MKTPNFKIYILIIAGFFVSGCAQTAPKYQTTSSATQLTSIGSSPKISIGEIGKNQARIDMACRFSTISFEGGENVETYIKNAMVNEFKSAGIYSETSGKKLSANIDYISLDSFSALEILSPAAQQWTEAKWKITMTFKGDGVDPFTIPSIFMFPLRDGMFDFGDPCDNPSKKFGAAFSNLIKILYKHPSFTKFITN